MICLFLRCFIVFGSILFSAEDLTWGDAQVQVIHFPCQGPPSYAAFRDDLVVQYPAPLDKGCILNDALREQVLAGYLLKFFVDEKSLCDDVFFKPGVYECMCKREPFFSEELRVLFRMISGVLHAKSHAGLTQNPLGLSMTSQDVDCWIYPEGCTRKWRVIRAKKVQKDCMRDTVCIVFKGREFALEGTLSVGASEADACAERRLLHLKRLHEWHKTHNPAPVRGVVPSDLYKKSAVCQFFVKSLNRDNDLNIICAGEPNKIIGLQSKDISVPCILSHGAIKGKFSGKMSLFNFVKQSFLHGYVPTQSSHHHIDTKLVMQPHVRSVVCHTQAFTAPTLQKALMLCKQLPHGAWVADVLDRLNPEKHTYLWTVVDDEQFLRKFLLKEGCAEVPSGIVFCLMRGETAVLQGVSAPKTHNVVGAESLWSFWVKNTLLQKGFKPIS